MRARARRGSACIGPIDGGDQAGYFALIADPDGHNLEVSFGQEVGLTVASKATD
jgi:hypothetical protein